MVDYKINITIRYWDWVTSKEYFRTGVIDLKDIDSFLKEIGEIIEKSVRKN